MIRSFFIILLLIGVLFLQVFAGEGNPVSNYFMYPQLKWEDELLTGELSNCPVKTLLEELSRKEDFQLEIVGDLNVSYSNSVVKLKNLNLKKIKHCNINKIFFEQINLPRNLNRIHLNLKLDLSFDHLTLEQSIKKIMRLSNLS